MESLQQQLFRKDKAKNARFLADCILDKRYDIEELFSLFYGGDMRTCQYASFPMEALAKREPSFFDPYLERMLLELDNPNHIPGVIRNTLRVWQFLQFPEDIEGRILEKAFVYFEDPSYAIAIRVFAMTVCVNLAVKFPELAPEIITVIEDNWDHTTAAWRSRGKRELKRLEKIMRQQEF